MQQTNRLVGLVAQAAARTVARAQLVTERYTEQELAITKAEADKHMQDYGHMYDEDCAAEFCNKVRAMYAAASPMGGA